MGGDFETGVYVLQTNIIFGIYTVKLGLLIKVNSSVKTNLSCQPQFLGKSAGFRLYLYAYPFLCSCVCLCVTIVRTGHTLAKIKNAKK